VEVGIGVVEVGAGGGAGSVVGSAREEVDDEEADAAEVGAFSFATDDGSGTGTSWVDEGNAGDSAGSATGSLEDEETCEAAADLLVG
jgi:hypothetical protein